MTVSGMPLDLLARHRSRARLQCDRWHAISFRDVRSHGSPRASAAPPRHGPFLSLYAPGSFRHRATVTAPPWGAP